MKYYVIYEDYMEHNPWEGTWSTEVEEFNSCSEAKEWIETSPEACECREYERKLIGPLMESSEEDLSGLLVTLHPLKNLALQVSNDISEDIDNNNTKKELRNCIKWWATYAREQSQRRAILEQKEKIWKTIKKLVDLA